MDAIDAIVSRVMKVFDAIISASAGAGAGLVLFMMLSIGYEVFMRRVLNAPTAWATPVAEFTLLFITFLAAPIVLRREGHVRMTAVVEQLGNRARLWLYIIGSLVSSGVCGLMTYRTGMTTWEQLSKQQVLIYGIEVPQYLVTWIIPYGFGLLTIQFFRMGVNAFRRKSYSETVEELGV